MLRHRARTMLIVCPAGLTLQWRDEMRDKFGLDFRIVDTALLKELRRSRGLYANPWTHFPRLIVCDRLAQAGPPDAAAPRGPPRGCPSTRAPSISRRRRGPHVRPAGRGKYATDSQRTQAIRTLAPHFEHRLFLSATPHNGYLESFTALLEMLDHNRFMRTSSQRGAAQAHHGPPHEARAATEVGRHSAFPAHHRTPRGRPLFRRARGTSPADRVRDQRHDAARRSSERALRRQLRHDAAQEAAVLLAEAFDDTLETHLATMTARRFVEAASPTPRRASGPSPARGTPDETRRTTRPRRAPEEALTAARRLTDAATRHEKELSALGAWARQAQDRPDPKFEALRAWLESTARPSG